EAYHPFATEGGHSSFAPRTALDVELFYFLSKQFGHVSWERVVSGRGIENIFHFLRDEKKRQVPEFIQKAAEAGDFAKEITANAGSCQVCRETLDLFLCYLSIELSHIALKFKSTSGVCIGGGIIPNIIDQVDVDVFLENFRDCGGMRSLLEDVPVKVILNERTALLGAAYYGAYQSQSFCSCCRILEFISVVVFFNSSSLAIMPCWRCASCTTGSVPAVLPPP